jgi:hypothetical protein
VTVIRQRTHAAGLPHDQLDVDTARSAASLAEQERDDEAQGGNQPDCAAGVFEAFGHHRVSQHGKDGLTLGGVRHSRPSPAPTSNAKPPMNPQNAASSMAAPSQAINDLTTLVVRTGVPGA